MIVINIKGGLGNQMFQYALGRKLALQNSDELLMDTSGLDRANEMGDIYRPFSLGQFSIAGNVANPAQVQQYKNPYGIFSKILRKFRFKVLRQMHMGWEPGILQIKKTRYLDGYWQSPKYFESIRAELLSDFSLREGWSETGQTLGQEMSASESVSIHVRRGDYVANSSVHKAYGECSLGYYQAAIEKIKNKIKNPTFYIFSDDVSWVKDNLPVGDAVFVSGQGLKDAEEILLMSKCEHNIIANSTFSWWGAWLNQNKGKIVIAPKPWFEVNEKFFQDLIPETWIRLSKNQ